MQRLSIEKLNKAIDSIERAKGSIESNDFRKFMGDIDFIKENLQEALYCFIVELEELGD